MMCVAGPRFVEEYIPAHLYSTLSPVFCVMGSLGGLVAVAGGLILPPDSSVNHILVNDTTWRYLFGFPLLPQLAIIIAFVFFIRFESPKFYLMKADCLVMEGEETSEEAKEMIKKC